jgi:hypothetical protein
MKSTIHTSGPRILTPSICSCKGGKKSVLSLIKPVILSAGAMLIFSVYFHLTKRPEGPKGEKAIRKGHDNPIWEVLAITTESLAASPNNN